jgi:hypothetical protein
MEHASADGLEQVGLTTSAPPDDARPHRIWLRQEACRRMGARATQER